MQPLLFKFTERKYLESFFETGSLRLGTIYDFKDFVGYGQIRGDAGEGLQTIQRENQGIMRLTEASHEPIISEFFNIQPGADLTLVGGVFERKRGSPDAFIFCTSFAFTEVLFEGWFAEEGLDACYEIAEPRNFFAAISKKITESANFLGYRNVTYTEETIDFDSPQARISPALTKFRDDYCWQLENRAHRVLAERVS